MTTKVIHHAKKAAGLWAAIFLGILMTSNCSINPRLTHPPTPQGHIFISPSEPGINPSWHLTGPAGLDTTGTGESWLQVDSSGKYSITWMSLAGWLPPLYPDEEATLTVGDTITFYGDYRQYLQVTNGSYVDTSPTWSPDGKMLAFSSNMDGDFDIWKTFAYSSIPVTPIKLTDNDVDDHEPDWSSDNNRIVFYQEQGMDDFFRWVSYDGTDEGTYGPSSCDFNFGNGCWSSPSFSPDMGLMAFVSHTDQINCIALGELHVFVTGGYGCNWVTNGCGSYDDLRDCDWSSTGDAIAFSWMPEATPFWRIGAVKPDRSECVDITSGPYRDRHPSWSPDDNYICFSSDRSGKSEIWITSSTPGKSPIQITSDQYINHSPAWSPDGNAIAYVSNRGESGDIWLVSVPDLE